MTGYFLVRQKNSEIKQVMTYESFYDDLTNGRIERLRIVNDYFKGLYKDAVIVRGKSGKEMLLYIADVSDFLKNLELVQKSLNLTPVDVQQVIIPQVHLPFIQSTITSGILTALYYILFKQKMFGMQ